MPVGSNEHQRIDDVSTDLISFGTVTRDNWFRIVTHELVLNEQPHKICFNLQSITYIKCNL